MWDTQQVQYLSGTPKDSCILSSSVVFSDYTPFQSTFRGGNSWCQDPPPPRSAERTLPEGPIEPFHHSIEFGRSWRKDEELDTVFLTGLLKFPIEFTPSIYLNGSHWKGALPEEFLEEHPGEIGCGPGMEGGIGPPGDKISSRNFLHTSLRIGVQGIDCHKIARRYVLPLPPTCIIRPRRLPDTFIPSPKKIRRLT